MAYKSEADEIRTLGRILEKGYLYRGLKPVNWCFDCGSALAEAEVEYEDRQDIAIDVHFPLIDPAEREKLARAFGLARAPDGPIGTVIWTTTPWTIPSNQALNAHPDFTYALVATPRGHLVLAEDLVASSLARFKLEGQRGRDGEGRGARADRVPASVLRSRGAGLPRRLRDAGAGDRHRPQLARVRRRRLPLVPPLRDEGRGHADAGAGRRHVRRRSSVLRRAADLGRESEDRREDPRGGQPAARREVHAQLHALLAAQDADHLPRDDAVVRRDGRRAGLSRREARRAAARDGAPRHREHALLPGLGQVAPLRDDREPARLDAVAAADVGRAAAVLRRQGHRRAASGHARRCSSSPRRRWSEAASRRGSSRRTRTSASTRHATGSSPTRSTSGSTPDRRTRRCWAGPKVRRSRAGSHAQDTGFPADLYLEGSDQHRGWFHSSLLVSCMRNGVPPYKALLTHGFTVDGEGRKMSKSKGNVVAPQKVSDTLGAEILRLWVAATDYSGDLSISDEILKRVVESYRRIRNTLRFLLANTSDFDPGEGRRARRRALRARSLRARERAGAPRRLSRRLRSLRVPPRRAATVDLLLRGPGRLLPRRAEGSPLHGGEGEAARGARRRRRSSTSATRCSGCSRRSCRSPPRRRGGSCIPRTRRSSSTRGAMRCRRWPDAAALLAKWPRILAVRARGAEGARGAAASTAGSARRCRRRSRSRRPTTTTRRSRASATTCAS